MNIQLQKIGKNYIRNQKEFWVFRNLEMQLQKGDFVTVVGKSGTGKSTLLNMVAGMIKPSEGDVLYDGVSLLNSSDQKLATFRNQRMSYVGQGQSLLTNLNVWDNIRLPNQLYDSNRKILQCEQEELMKKLQILELRNAYPEQLSGGEMRRIAIARALINSPDLILADEPTGDLDEENTIIILEIMKKLAENGKIIFMVTHDKIASSYSNAVYSI